MKNKKIDKTIIIRIALAVFVVFALTLALVSAVRNSGPKTLVIGWFDFPVVGVMPRVTKDFTDKTGIKVVFKNFPLEEWEREFYDNVCSPHPDYDLFVGDSQWLGYGAENNCYEDLTSVVNKNKLWGKFVNFAIDNYGEFPANSEKYYAVPFSGNSFIYAYRKDWFENETEKKNFYNRYGYELSYPRTVVELRDIAEFFTRPEEGKYGIVFPTSSEYDCITMQYGTFLFGAGGDWGDYASCDSDGHINSDRAIRTLKLFKELKGYMPPKEAINYADVGRLFMKGDVAVMSGIAAHGFDLTDNPDYKKMNIGWFGSLYGEGGGFSQLAGQGISISKNSSQKELARKFIDWWITEDTQRLFAREGGLTLEKKAISSNEFKDVQPFNVAYSDSAEFMKDFWNVPSYDKLLIVSQKNLYDYFYDKSGLSAKETLDKINEEWKTILNNDQYCSQMTR